MNRLVLMCDTMLSRGTSMKFLQGSFLQGSRLARWIGNGARNAVAPSSEEGEADAFSSSLADEKEMFEMHRPLCEKVLCLMLTLRELSSEWFARTFSDDDKESLTHLMQEYHMASIEVVIHDKLRRVWFTVPAEVSLIAGTMRDNFVEDVDRSTSETKLLEFNEFVKRSFESVQHLQYLQSKGVANVFSANNMDMFLTSRFTCTILLNTMMLLSYDVTDLDGTEVFSLDALFTEATTIGIITFFGYTHLFFASMIVLQFLVVQAPLLLMKYGNVVQILSDWPNSQLLTHLCMLLFSVFGNLPSPYGSPALFCLSLLEVFNRFPTAKIVLDAVFTNFSQLVLTFAVVMVLLFICATMHFFNMRGEVSDDYPLCDSLFSCFMMYVNLGTRMGGGIGDIMDTEDYFTGFIYRWFYFVIINIIMMNIVFGIIVDTFGELRGEKIAKMEDRTGICFICGHERVVFEREGKGFQTHIDEDHNMWQYLNFLLYILLLDKDDLNALESHLYKCLYESSSIKNIMFYPQQRALILQQSKMDEVASEHEQLLEQQRLLQESQFAAMDDKISELAGDVGAMRDTLAAIFEATKERNERT